MVLWIGRSKGSTYMTYGAITEMDDESFVRHIRTEMSQFEIKT
jgi:hypothetical protein